MTTPHPQGQLSLIALNNNLRREELARHNAMSTIAERRERDRAFDVEWKLKGKKALR